MAAQLGTAGESRKSKISGFKKRNLSNNKIFPLQVSESVLSKLALEKRCS